MIIPRILSLGWLVFDKSSKEKGVTQENESLHPHKSFYVNNSFLFQRPEVDTTQMSINRWMNAHIILYSVFCTMEYYSAIKTELLVRHKDMDESQDNHAEKSQEKSTHCMISFILKSRKCKLIYSYTKQIRDSLGRSRRNYKGEEETLGCNRYVYSSLWWWVHGCNTHPNLSTWTLYKYVQFILRQLYLTEKQRIMCKFNSWICLCLA